MEYVHLVGYAYIFMDNLGSVWFLYGLNAPKGVKCKNIESPLSFTYAFFLVKIKALS